MINYNAEMAQALETILPTYYEMTLTADSETPCLSYMELNNYISTLGDTLGYSMITYQVKVWGYNIGELHEYAAQVDDVLRPLGFRRTSTKELHDRNSAMIQKILTYEATGFETFN